MDDRLQEEGVNIGRILIGRILIGRLLTLDERGKCVINWRIQARPVDGAALVDARIRFMVT